MKAAALLLAAAAVNPNEDPTWVPTWNDAAVLAYYRDRPMRVLVAGEGVVMVAQPIARELQVQCAAEADCMVSTSKYTTFEFTAVPAPGSSWKGWSGGCIAAGMAPVCRITNSDPHTVLAVFGAAP